MSAYKAVLRVVLSRSLAAMHNIQCARTVSGDAEPTLVVVVVGRAVVVVCCGMHLRADFVWVLIAG